MAVDKKSQHVGNNDGRYTDIDGNTKQFTYIDHDVKTKIATSKMSDKELNNIKKSITEHRKSLIFRILSISASICPFEWADFVIRSENGIKWNDMMLKDEGLSIDKLQTLVNLLENKMDLI